MAAKRRSDRVRINVGGTQFVTASTTIANAGRDSMLCSLLDDNWQPNVEGEEIFIDRNPDYFKVLLDLLRTGELRVPYGMPLSSLIREAVFYGIEQHVKSASWESPLDCNRVVCRASIRDRAVDDPVAIRASPAGGCGVAHGCMVHLYDWSLERLRPINLDFMTVNDFGFLMRNPARVMVCSMDRGEIGGLGCFNSSTGRLEQRYRLDFGGDSSISTIRGRSFMALACASSESEVFASCMRGTKGIGIWNQETAQNVSFVPSTQGGSKLQWLPSSNSLLVASMFPQSDHCFFTLLDPRARSVAWEWSDCEIVRNEPVIMDAVAIESRSMICVVDQYDNLGFIDTRMQSACGPSHSGIQNRDRAAVSWSHMFPRIKRSDLEEHSYAKLRTNCSPNSENLQLLSTREDAVLIYSCSASFVSAASACNFNALPRTANLVSGVGGSISDIDVDADRLFVLHSDENVFDVWETPVIYSGVP